MSEQTFVQLSEWGEKDTHGRLQRHYGGAMSAMSIDVQQFSVDAMLSDIRDLVNVESPSRDVQQLWTHARVLAEIITRRTGIAPELVDSPVGPHVHWKGGSRAKVLLLGHHDTVHQLGSLEVRPFSVRDGRATGPGVFDMKAGIVQAIHAVAGLDDASHVEMLFTSDEETGSRVSRALVEERAVHAGAVLVLEPSADGGALKVGRKGTGNYYVRVRGRASHAGLEPEKGINALLGLAEVLPKFSQIERPDLGTTLTPTLASAGTADNVVPADATATIDVRVSRPDERERVEREVSRMSIDLVGAELEISGGMNRPPMHSSTSTELMKLAQLVANDLGLEPLHGVEVGGGSDGNFTAAVGVHTLDGLGAVGGGAHGDGEHIIIDTLPSRAALVAGLAQRLSSMDKMAPLPSVPADR